MVSSVKFSNLSEKLCVYWMTVLARPAAFVTRVCATRTRVRTREEVEIPLAWWWFVGPNCRCSRGGEPMRACRSLIVLLLLAGCSPTPFTILAVIKGNDLVFNSKGKGSWPLKEK